jgi:hypothetical protein
VVKFQAKEVLHLQQRLWETKMAVLAMKIDQATQGMRIQIIKKEHIRIIKFQIQVETECYLEKIKRIKV